MSYGVNTTAIPIQLWCNILELFLGANSKVVYEYVPMYIIVAAYTADKSKNGS